MIILAIESSCDETAVALVRDGREVLTDQVFSQADLHAIYGGVVPEIASRSHVEVISQLADRALAVTGLTRGDIDAVAVTCAPGLIGALLVGVNFAKSAALALGVPLIPVHHVRGHIAANYIAYPELKPPFVCLAISGGNTLICDVRDYTDLRILGATRDDAAGECFDKTARVLGLPDSIGCFSCRYYSQKEGYTGMKLICSLFITFLKIGAFTFGGGYAMIAQLENEFVEKKKWLEKSEFLDMVAVAESTPGPVAINSATYIGYKIAGFAGATMSTLAVSIPSFFVIYGISLFFDQFLSLRWVSCAFHGIQVCVIYLILTAGLKMLKSIDKNTLNLTILTLVVASMLFCSITAVSFSSVFYILICGAVGLVVFFLRKIRKGDGKTS